MATASIIADIEKLKSGITAPPPVTGCAKSSAAPKESVLNGTYVWTVTRKALEDNGVSDAQALNDVPAVHTGVLADGSISITRKLTEGPNKGDVDEGHFTYEFDGRTITFHWSQSPTNCTKATVKIMKHGSLAFSDLVECAEDEMGRKLDEVGFRVWKKIK